MKHLLILSLLLVSTLTPLTVKAENISITKAPTKQVDSLLKSIAAVPPKSPSGFVDIALQLTERSSMNWSTPSGTYTLNSKGIHYDVYYNETNVKFTDEIGELLHMSFYETIAQLEKQLFKQGFVQTSQSYKNKYYSTWLKGKITCELNSALTENLLKEALLKCSDTLPAAKKV